MMTGYATTTLSGDVAAAMQLLRRVTKPTTKAQKRGLILPLHELAACEARPTRASCKWPRTHKHLQRRVRVVVPCARRVSCMPLR